MGKDFFNESKYMLRNGILYKSCPSCSKAANTFVFYGCPEYFGYRHDNEKPYSQSLCSKCRGRSLPPTELFDGYILSNDSDVIVPAIRILPMSKEVFATYTDCKNFFLNTMPARGNTFYFKSHRLNIDRNTFVLFQYDSQIVAYGIFDSEAYISSDSDFYAEGYIGFYTFAKNSLCFLETPITDKTMYESFLVKLSQATSNIKLSYFPALMELLDEVQDDIVQDENKVLEKKTIKLVSNFSITGIHTFSPSTQNSVTKDYVKAQKNQMAVGALGEELIYRYEKNHLMALGLTALSEQVKIVSNDTSLGYDIVSYNEQGLEIHIEVKSKAGLLKYFDFYISENEYQKLKANANHFVYYISHLRSLTPFLFKLNGDMINDSNTKPVLYRVALNYEINESK